MIPQIVSPSAVRALATTIALGIMAALGLSCGGGGSGDGGTGPETPTVVIDSIRPDTATAGRTGFQIAIHGQHFANGAQVLINGTARAATVSSAIRLFANLSTAEIASPDTLTVTVSVPGAITSTAAPFRVLPAPPRPVLLALSTDSVESGTSLTLIATGQHIYRGSRLQWDGQILTSTAFLDSTRVQGFLPVNLNGPGVHQVAVHTFPPGGGTSNTLPVTSYAGTPSLGSVTPDTATAGRTDLTVTASGTGYYPNSVVRFDGVAQPTTFNSATGKLTATIAPSAIATAGTVQVTVFTPPPGGGVSNALTFTVYPAPPVPTLTALSEDSVISGQTVQVVATGTGFSAGTALHWNGVARPTALLSSTQITAAFTGSAGGTLQVTAVTPPPGGGTSNPLPFRVIPLNPVPTVTDFAPQFSVSTTAAATLSILGSGFAPGASVLWGGAPRTAMVVSSTQIDVALLAGDLAVIRNITLAVTNPAPGGGTAFASYFIVDPRTIAVSTQNLPVLDVLWDATRQLLYASVAGINPSTLGRVVAIDPITGAIARTVGTTEDPLELRPAADWSRLYTVRAGDTRMQIIDLTSFTISGSFPIDTTVSFDFYFDASPHNPLAVALTTTAAQGLPWGVVTTFLTGTRSSTETSSMRGPVAYDTSGAYLFARSGLDTSLVVISVPFGEPVLEEVQPHLGISAQERWMASVGDRLYTNRGGVIDIVNYTRLPSLGFAGRTVRSVAIDAARDRVYTLEVIPADAQSPAELCALGKYGLASLQYLDEQQLPFQCPPHDLVAGAAGFVRWGTDGVAFRGVDEMQTTGLRFVLLRTALID